MIHNHIQQDRNLAKISAAPICFLVTSKIIVEADEQRNKHNIH
jgi:hypothetical protein